MRRDEAELPRRGVVAAAGDQNVSEPAERRAAAVPVDERQQGMTRAAVSVGLQCARVAGGAAFGLAQRRRVRTPGAARRREERAVRLLRRVAEVTLEPVQQDRRASLRDRERVAPEAEREAEPEI